MKRLFCFILMILCFVGGDVCAQIMGTSTNYSGSRGLALNPSLMTTSYVYADFGLNLSMSAYNDFIYLKSTDYYSLWKYGETSEYLIYGKSFDYGFDMNGKSKNLYETVDFNIFSAMFNNDGYMAWGIFLNNRIYSNGTKLPWEIAEASVMGIEGGDYLERNYKSYNGRFGMMAWSELGLSWSKVIHEGYHKKLDFGVTAKGLLGYLGLNLNLNEVDKDIYTADSIMIHKVDLQAAISGPVDYTAKFDGGNIFDAGNLVNGLGVGFDIGFTYTYNKDYNTRHVIGRPCEIRRIPYVWRLGVSLLDVGAIHYNKNARTYKMFSDKDSKFDGQKLDGVQDFDEMMERLGDMFYDDPSQMRGNDDFWMGLPTALSVQLDYSFEKNYYLNVTWVQPVKLFDYSAYRPALFVVEPRYEKKYFDIAIPVTYYNYEKFFLGVEARLDFLTIGTQNLFNAFGVGYSYGLDLYVALKFNLYKERCSGDKGDDCWNFNYR